MKDKLAIGVDVGGTNTKFGVVNKKGEIIVQDRIRTDKRDSVAEFIEDLAEKLIPMIDAYGGVENFVGLGMGAPNANYHKGLCCQSKMERCDSYGRTSRKKIRTSCEND